MIPRDVFEKPKPKWARGYFSLVSQKSNVLLYRLSQKVTSKGKILAREKYPPCRSEISILVHIIDRLSDINVLYLALMTRKSRRATRDMVSRAVAFGEPNAKRSMSWLPYRGYLSLTKPEAFYCTDPRNRTKIRREMLACEEPTRCSVVNREKKNVCDAPPGRDYEVRI